MLNVGDRVVVRNYENKRDCFGTISKINGTRVWCDDWTVGARKGYLDRTRFYIEKVEKTMVDWTKEIEYVIGTKAYPAKIVGTDVLGNRIVLGDTGDGNCYFASFTEEGKKAWSEDNSGEVFIRNKKRKVWVNLYYRYGSSTYIGYGNYDTKKYADDNCVDDRVACVEIEI